MQVLLENAPDELIVLLDFQSNWSIDAEVSLAFASAVLEVIRAEVGSGASVELLRAGTSSKWFSFRFIDLAALAGVALAVESSALTEGTLLNRTIAQADEIARIASLVIKPGQNDPKTILRRDFAILVRRDERSEIQSELGRDDKDETLADFSFEEPVRWLGRFVHREGEPKFVVGERKEYFCRFEGELGSTRLPMRTPVGLVGKRILSHKIGKGQIVVLRVFEMVENWQQRWIEDTTAGEVLAVRSGGYFRLLPDSNATFSTFAGPNFLTSSEPVEAGPYKAGQRLIADVRLVTDREGQISAHFHKIVTEEQFIDEERGTYEMARNALTDPLDQHDG